VFSQTQDANRLRNFSAQFLDQGDIERALPLVRQYLEYKLLYVISKVSIPVPLDFAIRDDRKMVEHALHAILEAVALHQRAGGLVLAAKQRADLDTLIAPAIVANWVNHYATGIAASFTSFTLKGILQTVDDFVECFRYDCTCHGGVQRRFYKSLASKDCRC
jgi:hypothetical protein